MRLTPEQIAKISKKEAETPDALKRNPLNDYTEGWFHVTLNTRGEAPVLGYLTGDPDAEDGSANAPRCVLTELGKKVEESWKNIPTYYPEVEIDAFMAMPEHIHGLLHLKPANRVHLGQIIRGFMIGCTHGYWDTLGIAWGASEQKRGGIPPVFTDRDHTRSYRGPALMVRGYNDVEAVTEEEIEIKRQYIRNNPRKRLIQNDKPDLFRVWRNMKSTNWTPERIMQGLCADRFIAADRNKQVEAWRQITVKGIRNSRGKISATLKFVQIPAKPESTESPESPKFLGSPESIVTSKTLAIPKNLETSGTHETTKTHETSGTLETTKTHETSGTLETTKTLETISFRPVIDLVGNMDLLKRPLFPLVCHRADVNLFEQQKDAVLKVAREQGGVIVTACVSPKEREIVKMLQQELLPVIEVMDNGFNERYKPTGRNFYAVAEQRRLEVAPWEYEYRRREMRPAKDAQGNPILDANGQQEMEEVPDISREMCMVMNELVRMIAKKEDDWWK